MPAQALTTFDAAYQKFLKAPLTLTEDDLAALEQVDPLVADRARRASTDASLAVIHKAAAAVPAKSAASPGSRRAVHEWREKGLVEKWDAACVAVFLAADHEQEVAELTKFFEGRLTKSAIVLQFVPILKILRIINTKNRERNARLDALEARMQALEARPGFKYCGTWKVGATYDTGDAVTRAGALWIATAQTVSEPGKGAGWQLAVKRGDA